jgi:hypothetical protein
MRGCISTDAHVAIAGFAMRTSTRIKRCVQTVPLASVIDANLPCKGAVCGVSIEMRKGEGRMSDLFGGLGGLMKGLSGFMPQDDPDVKLMMAGSEVSDLQKQETELYAQIGKQALAQGHMQFPELEKRLHLVQENLSAAQAKLQSAQADKEEKDLARRAEEEARLCPDCNNMNPEGIKFCQECGTRLGGQKCAGCGASLSPGIRFCGECGAEQEG